MLSGRSVKSLSLHKEKCPQERILKDKQKPQEASDTATSGQPPAAANASSGAAAPTPQDVSPFACLSSTMGWDTFHMVHVLWIGMVDTAGKPAERDWGLQVHAKLSVWLFVCCCFHLRKCWCTAITHSLTYMPWHVWVVLWHVWVVLWHMHDGREQWHLSMWHQQHHMLRLQCH